MNSDLIPRKIPVLLLKDKGLYKGKKFKSHRYIGDPINTVKLFNDKGADELIFLDIEATARNKIDYDLLKSISSESFMPLSYGGGISSLNQIYKLINLGFEKVVLNTHIFNNELLLKEAIKEFGSTTICVSIDYKHNFFGRKNVFINSGEIKTNLDPINYVEFLNDKGVGEILFNSIDKEGSRLGYEIDYFEEASKVCNVPIIISGGCKDFNEFNHLVENNSIFSFAAGSCFIFQGKKDAVLIQYPSFKV